TPAPTRPGAVHALAGTATPATRGARPQQTSAAPAPKTPASAPTVAKGPATAPASKPSASGAPGIARGARVLTPAGAAAASGSPSMANAASRTSTRSAPGGAIPVMTPMSVPAVPTPHARTPAPTRGGAAAGRHEQPRGAAAAELQVETPSVEQDATPTEVVPIAPAVPRGPSLL